ncbi:MAG TPA: PH domain-containing protein [Candidatus Koribacter sp.]|jgi:uncharacterized membrane protein YdbT with pleckstrin-like domain
MSYIDHNLIPGEQVIYRTRLHWIVIFWHLVFGLILVAVGVYVAAGMPGTSVIQPDQAHYARIGGAVLLGIGLLLIIISFVRRNSVEMAVTNKRVTVKVGLVSRSTEEMMLTRIESIMVDQSLMGRMFGFGTITLRGVGGTPDPFPRISHPLEFRRQVQHQLDLIQSPAAAPPPTKPLQ